MRRVIRILLVLTVLGVSAYYFFYAGKGRNSNGRVFVSGNIEAVEVDLSFRISGQIKTLKLEEGDRVQKDQVIATLDTDSLVAMKGSAEAEIAVLRAALDELEEGSRAEEIEAGRAAAKAAESRLKLAKDEYDRYVPLFKEKAISASTFDSRANSYRVAVEEHNSAAQRLQELERGPRVQTIRAARSRLERAGWELKKILLDIEHSTLTSPITGTALVKSMEEGEVTLPGATVAVVAKTDEVWLKGYIGEDQLGRVKLGQQVKVSTDTFPDKRYTGVITFISSRAEFTPKNVQTKEERVKQVYRVKVTIPNTENELMIGMPAEGWILTDQAAAAKEVHGEKPGS
jgi:HlyD family secretion protein